MNVEQQLKPVPRARDEQALAILRALAMGYQPKVVAARFGILAPGVSTLRQRVMAADLAESGEPAEIVRAAYWP